MRPITSLQPVSTPTLRRLLLLLPQKLGTWPLGSIHYLVPSTKALIELGFEWAVSQTGLIEPLGFSSEPLGFS